MTGCRVEMPLDRVCVWMKMITVRVPIGRHRVSIWAISHCLCQPNLAAARELDANRMCGPMLRRFARPKPLVRQVSKRARFISYGMATSPLTIVRATEPLLEKEGAQGLVASSLPINKGSAKASTHVPSFYPNLLPSLRVCFSHDIYLSAHQTRLQRGQPPIPSRLGRIFENRPRTRTVP